MSSPADWSSALIDLAALGFGYLLGSIPFGLILTRLAGLGDVRKIGSGNIGATNVLRAGSKKLAAATLILDAAKGTVAVLIAANWGETPALLAGLGAFLGHLFPVWLGFRGGKGVATYVGVLLGLYWPAGIAFCVMWLLVAVATRYSSLSALVASAGSLGILAFMTDWRLVALFLLLTVLLYIRHAANIERLAKGEETQIGKSSP
jgi:glycerol-3-phosphate acyltransferase PlsY